jgi:predicted alpha/beta-hydrolase family hydrolase
MSESRWNIPVRDAAVSAVYDAAENARAVLVCAHGAGGNLADRGMATTAAEMVRRGISVVRFNFLYKERGSGRPDPMPVLMETVDAVVQHVRAELAPKTLLIGGRSMGGRAASMLAAEGYEANGLLLLAYPLHPAGQPEKLRDAHLPRITMPVLCFSGTRDALCTPALMERALTTVTAPWDMHGVEGADHSFHVLKSSGRTDAEVMSEIGATTSDWVTALKS